jgi:archaellum component FlaF (FlaF/FlaG flagellin family)
MGFSIIAASSIIGVAFFISFEIMSGSILPSISEVNKSFLDLKERRIDLLHTEIEIQKTLTFGFGATYSLIIIVKNNGITTIENTDECTILLNGESYSFSCTVSNLYPEKQENFYIINLVKDGMTKKIKLTTPNGISVTDSYTAPAPS